MSKKCTPLWREAHLQAKKLKTLHVRSTFGSWDVEKVDTVVARSTFRRQNGKSTRGSDHFSDVVSRDRRKGLCTLSKVSKTWWFCRIFNYNHHYITLHSNTLQLQLHLRYATLHYTTLHSPTLHHTKLHYTPLRYTTLHYTTLHYIPVRYTTLHYTTLHYTTPNDTALYLQLQLHLQLELQLHYITLHYTNDITLHYITLQYITLTTTT